MLSPYYKTSPSTGHSDPSSGFAGMLLSNPNLEYGKVLAIAGTEPTGGEFANQLYWDLMFSDVGQIGFLGGAFNQAVSLFNYVQALKAPGGVTNVLRLEVKTSELAPPGGETNYITQIVPGPAPLPFHPKYYWLEAHHDGEGLGLIGENEKLTVTGHSLGGHLAALAVALFPETFTRAYTYNAPGFNPLSSMATQPLGIDGLLNLFRDYGAHPGNVASITNRVITLEAEDAIPGDDHEIVSSSATGTPFSAETYLATERVTHDIGHLTEGLALQAMLAKLDPGMTRETASAILVATTAQSGETYEKLLEQFNLMLTGNPLSLRRTEPSISVIDGGDFNIRNEFFVSYFALQNSTAFKSLEGKISISTTFATADEARTDFGAFLSLYYLTSFTLKIDDPTQAYLLQTANPGNNALALMWMEDKLLTPDQRTQGQGNYSDAWLTDRAAMLGWQTRINIADGHASEANPYLGLGPDLMLDTPAQHFEDLDSGDKIITGLGERRRILFGGNAADPLTGGTRNDRLYGGLGNDALEGGAGNDWLEGGQGTDTYIYATGDGVIDSGRELFGDSTHKSTGQTALDGFDALRDLDSNADGKISSTDAQFGNLRVWRDHNQDGISQSGELYTLSSLQIASINVAASANSQTLANGNQIADLGTYTRTDGSTGTTGEISGTLGDINLGTDVFHRQFTDHLDTSAIAALPDMQACPELGRRGSGAVRDLREAANDGEWRVAA